MKCTYFAYKFSDEIPLSRYDHILTLTEIGSSFLQSCVSSMDVVKSLKGGMHDPASIFAQIRRLIRKVVRVRKIKIRKIKKRKSSSNLSHSLFYYFCQNGWAQFLFIQIPTKIIRTARISQLS